MLHPEPPTKGYGCPAGCPAGIFMMTFRVLDYCWRFFPVVPHKAVAEVSPHRKPKGELVLWFISVSLGPLPAVLLSLYLSNHLSIYLHLHLHLYLYLYLYLSIYLPIYLSICLSIYLSIHPSIRLSIFLCIYLWTFKSGGNAVCFSHFDFEMRFVPLRRALFRHLNFQMWSEHVVFFACSLRHVLRATAACTLLPKVHRSWGVFNNLSWTCALHHRHMHARLPKVLRSKVLCTFSLPHVIMCFALHGGQFFARWLRSRRFSESTFRPSGTTKPLKNTVLRDFSTFRARWSSFFWLFLYSDCSHHYCCICPKVGSLTSKLPSVIFSVTINISTAIITRHYSD